MLPDRFPAGRAARRGAPGICRSYRLAVCARREDRTLSTSPRNPNPMQHAPASSMAKDTIPALPGAVKISVDLPKAIMPTTTMRPHANVQALGHGMGHLLGDGDAEQGEDRGE